MWRTRAIVSMLTEEIAGLEVHPEDSDLLSEHLRRACRRARLVIVVDIVAILILFFFRDFSRPFLPSGQSIDTVFTCGVLAVAAHAGFRWAQLLTLRSVERLCRDLNERDGG